MSRADDGFALVGCEMSASEPGFALMSDACDQFMAAIPKTIEHAGRTWWVSVMPGGPDGMAIVALFDSPLATKPVHCVVTPLGERFGHFPPTKRPGLDGF